MAYLFGPSCNAREVIQNIFSPMVGVICSSSANEACRRNNLSFVELIQPFAKLPNDAYFRDVSGTSVSVRGLRINICDLDWRPPQTVVARKMLNEAVSNAHNDRTKTVNIGNLSIAIPTVEPWFERWRETFLAVQFPADHEFTRHFLSTMIVLSSKDPNIIDTAQKLTQHVLHLQSVTHQKLPKWFNSSNVLNSYVVIHEANLGDLCNAQQCYESLKNMYGDNTCFFLQINSMNNSDRHEITDYWMPYIQRRFKLDSPAEQAGGVKTAQDEVSLTEMPTMQELNFSFANSEENVLSILHPLSPVQEHAMEAINSKFSLSNESLASHSNNWTSDLDSNIPCGSCLNSQDVENLRHFVQDYGVRALIPYAEQMVANLYESITLKKGVSKSLLSATKRWFITSKPGAGTSNQNAVIYTHESTELQTRKLGDLYFMFGHYNFAFQAYHQAKRDFNADSAWQYYAGALEMASLSAFMLGTSNRKTYDYMEDAIICYLTVCKLQQFATRATFLSVECLKTARNYVEAAKQLIRMTSEESDLRSALLLEQAAYCFLASQPSMYRKYAFQIVLSGNRYSRAGQRRHAYRCYKQAFQVFQEKEWSLAEDHIQYTMAKQAYALRNVKEASQSFGHLLKPGSQQEAPQQMNFLREYIQSRNEHMKTNPKLKLMPHSLPKVIQNSIRVLVLISSQPLENDQFVPASNINIESNERDEKLWNKIEEMIVLTAACNKPFVFKPTRSLFTTENPAIEYPLAVQGEPIQLSVRLLNSVKCRLQMMDIGLLWKLKLDNGESLSNETLCDVQNKLDETTIQNAIESSFNHPVVFEENTEETLYFKLTPKLTGLLDIIGIFSKVAPAFEPDSSLSGSLRFNKQLIRGTGKNLKDQIFDNKLSIKITPPIPSLHINFSPVPTNVIVGEIMSLNIFLRNSGSIPISDIYIGCESPRWVKFFNIEEDIPSSSAQTHFHEKPAKDKEIRRQHVFCISKNNDNVTLRAKSELVIPMCIQAPFKNGEFILRLLFYYQFANTSNQYIKYRVIRHCWKFNIYKSLQSEATCFVTNNSSGEIGLNVNVKNEIKPVSPIIEELYINTLSLYCNKYGLNATKFYFMDPVDIVKGQFGERCVKPSKCINLQCHLQKIELVARENASKVQWLNSLRSQITVIPAETNRMKLCLENSCCFLLNYENGSSSTTMSSEDLNKSKNRDTQYMTIVLDWVASITHNAEKRIAIGQHFVKLYYLHDLITIPSTVNSPLGRVLLKSKKATSRKRNIYMRESQLFKSKDDFWESNANFVGRHCLLEDDYVTPASK